MFQQANSLLLDKLIDHVAQHGTHSIEAFVRLTDVGETNIVEQDLLYNEDGHRLTELRASLHDTQTKRDDFGSEEEIDHF